MSATRVAGSAAIPVVRTMRPPRPVARSSSFSILVRVTFVREADASPFLDAIANLEFLVTVKRAG
jgi:hypothetical protein